MNKRQRLSIYKKMLKSHLKHPEFLCISLKNFLYNTPYSELNIEDFSELICQKPKKAQYVWWKSNIHSSKGINIRTKVIKKAIQLCTKKTK